MRLWQYALAAFVFDWLLYVVWTVVPLHAKDLGADAFDLGMLQAVSSAVYIVMSVVMGRVADRASRPLLVRIGCAMMIACCFLVPRTGSFPLLLAVMPVLGLAGTFFWPCLQGAIGAESSPERLLRDIGLFNILWSAGKSIGFLMGGSLKEGWGLSPTLMAAAGGAAAVMLFYPWRDTPRREASLSSRVAVDVRRRYLFIGWIMNFVAFGAGATIGNQYILLCRDRRMSLGFGDDPVETFFGLALFGVFLSQTIVFAVVRRWSGWTYRRAPLYGSQVCLAAGAVILGVAGNPWLALASTPLLGIGLGMGYVASIYYSLDTPEGHGKYSGLHEAIVGLGSFLPLAAGVAARGLGDLRWPYWLCAALALGAIVVEERIWRSR